MVGSFEVAEDVHFPEVFFFEEFVDLIVQLSYLRIRQTLVVDVCGFAGDLFEDLRLLVSDHNSMGVYALLTCPLYFSAAGIVVTLKMSRGRRSRPASMIPNSALAASRKRYSIDCAFSELRA